jgi:hypothetical protein
MADLQATSEHGNEAQLPDPSASRFLLVVMRCQDSSRPQRNPQLSIAQKQPACRFGLFLGTCGETGVVALSPHAPPQSMRSSKSLVLVCAKFGTLGTVEANFLATGIESASI